MNTVSSNLKVLHVYRTYFPDTQGGGQEVMRQICRNTLPLGIESRVFTPSEIPVPKEVLVDKTTVVRVKLNFEVASCGFCLTGFSEFSRQVDWADVIHYHFPWPFADVLHIACRVSKPTVITYHSDIVRQQGFLRFYTPLMHKFLSSIDCIVATSPNYRDSSRILERYKSKVRVVPIGLDETSYPGLDLSLMASCKKRYGEGFFLFVGVLRYYKGLHVLIDACRNAEFKVVIAGSGPLESELNDQIERLELDNVVLAGQISDEEKVALLTLCKGVVFSSHVRSEAFGVTLVEGAMFSKPLVTAEAGSGTSYVNEHEKTGLVVRANDPNDLAKAMSRLHENEDEAARLGLAARKRFEALFTGESMGVGYNRIYRKLADNAC
ncbi:MAG: glycosyltransferase [bacterium]